MPGNIHQRALHVQTRRGDWLFQHLNTDVFRNLGQLMENARQWADASNALAQVNPELGWREIEFAETDAGENLVDGWRGIRILPRTQSYRDLAQAPPGTAFELGKGLAISRAIGTMLAADELEPSLLGYRNSELYWRQYQAIVTGDPVGYLPEEPVLRDATSPLFIRAISEEEFIARRDDPLAQEVANVLQRHLDLARSLSEAVADGDLAITVIHGDTKLDNFLFDASTDAVCALIDLDTVMPHTWLVDFGDCIRSITNPLGESVLKLNKVRFEIDIYRELVNGLMSLVDDVSDAEFEFMPISAMAQTWEQCLRFYTDYLRGDTYYRLGSATPDFNLHRSAVQAKLLDQMLAHRYELAAMMNLSH
jgi:hypothetical protein